MYIQKIKISNFKSIYDTLELDFSSTIKGFWKISGEVGAGKTTIGEAIIFGLFGSVNGKNNSDLISWGEKHGLIELWCTSKGNNLYIRREINMYGQSPIYAEVNGDELVFTNKREAQQQLENDYYDTSRIMVELLCIISFNNFKSIATMNTKDTKIFLDKVLGFQILTQYSDICKTLKAENYAKIISTQQDINSISSQIKKLNELSNIEKIEGSTEDVQKNIKSLEDSIKHYKQYIKKITDDYNDDFDATPNHELLAIGVFLRRMETSLTDKDAICKDGKPWGDQTPGSTEEPTFASMLNVIKKGYELGQKTECKIPEDPEQTPEDNGK